MKTSESKSEQKAPTASDASKDIQNKKNTSTEKEKENPSDEEKQKFITVELKKVDMYYVTYCPPKQKPSK